MFKFELWEGNSTMLTESDFEFDTEDEAIEEGFTELKSRIETWKAEGAWHESTDSAKNYEIRTRENEE